VKPAASTGSGLKLSELLPRSHIIVPLEAETLTGALGLMLQQLEQVGVIGDRESLDRSVGDRRSTDLVLIGSHVALPHFRTSAVENLVVALGIAPAPLTRNEFERAPGPRIVALILAPPGEATLYLQTVSALARLLRQEGVVDDLLNARSADDVLGLAALELTQVLPRLTVRDMMVHIESVEPSTAVRAAVELMIRARVRALPVLNQKREVLGIITEWDVMRGLMPQIPRAGGEMETEESASQLKVRDIMTRSVLCVSEDLSVEEAASMMINKDVEQFPVVSEGKLTGFLSRSDILRKLFGR
jgi:CBS domain-containing protein/mannitol/fructose-specific phosphotransferase system IIA component (Ntr-type)